MTDIRTPLSDKAIAQVPTAEDGWYLARDTELKGFFVVVGKRKRTFTVLRNIAARRDIVGRALCASRVLSFR